MKQCLKWFCFVLFMTVIGGMAGVSVLCFLFIYAKWLKGVLGL